MSTNDPYSRKRYLLQDKRFLTLHALQPSIDRRIPYFLGANRSGSDDDRAPRGKQNWKSGAKKLTISNPRGRRPLSRDQKHSEQRRRVKNRHPRSGGRNRRCDSAIDGKEAGHSNCTIHLLRRRLGCCRLSRRRRRHSRIG